MEGREETRKEVYGRGSREIGKSEKKSNRNCEKEKERNEVEVRQRKKGK